MAGRLITTASLRAILVNHVTDSTYLESIVLELHDALGGDRRMSKRYFAFSRFVRGVVLASIAVNPGLKTCRHTFFSSCRRVSGKTVKLARIVLRASLGETATRPHAGAQPIDLSRLREPGCSAR